MYILDDLCFCFSLSCYLFKAQIGTDLYFINLLPSLIQNSYTKNLSNR